MWTFSLDILKLCLPQFLLDFCSIFVQFLLNFFPFYRPVNVSVSKLKWNWNGWEILIEMGVNFLCWNCDHCALAESQQLTAHFSNENFGSAAYAKQFWANIWNCDFQKLGSSVLWLLLHTKQNYYLWVSHFMAFALILQSYQPKSVFGVTFEVHFRTISSPFQGHFLSLSQGDVYRFCTRFSLHVIRKVVGGIAVVEW